MKKFNEMVSEVKNCYSIAKLLLTSEQYMHSSDIGIEIVLKTYSGQIYARYYGDWESAYEDCMCDDDLMSGLVQIVAINVHNIMESDNTIIKDESEESSESEVIPSDGKLPFTPCDIPNEDGIYRCPYAECYTGYEDEMCHVCCGLGVDE